MKKIVFLFLLNILCVWVYAQKIATAKDVQLVSTPGIQIVMKGGIAFSGNTSWKDSGTTILKANPIANLADWLDSTASGVLLNPYGHTIFNNTFNTQQIKGVAAFYNLRTDGLGINLQQSNEVKNNLQLNNGLVYFSNAVDSIYVSNPALAGITSSGGYATSWVHGKLARNTNNSAVVYEFPVGKINGADSLYAPVRIQKVNNNAAIYTAVYFPVTPPDHFNFMNPPIDHISEQEYWQLSSNILAGLDDDARVTLTWRPHSVVGTSAATRDSLLVAHYINNTGFRWEPEYDVNQANIVSGTVSSGSVTTNINVGSFIQAHKNFTLASRSPFNKLPLEWLDWAVAARNNTAQIQWYIINDVDVLHYEIERSFTGSLFSRVNNTPALHYAGNGTYTITDATPQPGWNFYRIKITGKNNRSYYTDIKKVYIGEGLATSVYPNPAQNVLNVQFSRLPAGNAGLEITDAAGRIVTRKTITDAHTVIHTSTWAKGVYVLRVQYEGGGFVQRFIKN